MPLPLAAGCAGPLSVLEPEGPAARGAATLWWWMLAGSAILFAAVIALLALSLVRPGALRGFGVARTLLWGGLMVPAAMLTALIVAAFALGEGMLARPLDPPALRIEAEARQWAWTFRYPDGTESEERLRIPAGQAIDFAVTSRDVIHSFWIPRLGGKIDAIPGHVNVVRLRADRPGIYRGLCAEYCGTGHATMPFVVEAEATP